MNMRWAWTLPVLTTLAIGLVAAQARAQGGPAPPWAGAPGMAGMPGMAGTPGTMAPPQAAYGVDPAMMAAMQAQAAPAMYAPPAGYQGATMFMPAGAFPQGAAFPQGYPVQPAAYMAGPMPDVYGSYGSVPTEYAPPAGGAPAYGPEAYGQPMYGGAPGYGGPGMGGPVMGGPMYGDQMGMGGPCGFCGGQGCDNCRGGIFGHGRHGGDGSWLPNGLLGDVLGCVAPYPDGGCAAPRWFDFAVDYMMMKRDNTGSNLALTSRGILGPIVLETDDPDFAFTTAKGGGITLEDRKTKRTYHVKAVPQGKDDYELEVTDAGGVQNHLTDGQGDRGTGRSRFFVLLVGLGGSGAKQQKQAGQDNSPGQAGHDERSGRRCGNRITSRMWLAPESTITTRSMPTPSPPVGGRPCSSARR